MTIMRPTASGKGGQVKRNIPEDLAVYAHPWAGSPWVLSKVC